MSAGNCNGCDYSEIVYATPENNNDHGNIFSSNYYDTDEMHNNEISNKNKSLCLFHTNACSVDKNFDNLQHLLSFMKNNYNRDN